jgi:hypothetical protein
VILVVNFGVTSLLLHATKTFLNSPSNDVSLLYTVQVLLNKYIKPLRPFVYTLYMSLDVDKSTRRMYLGHPGRRPLEFHEEDVKSLNLLNF